MPALNGWLEDHAISVAHPWRHALQDAERRVLLLAATDGVSSLFGAARGQHQSAIDALEQLAAPPVWRCSHRHRPKSLCRCFSGGASKRRLGSVERRFPLRQRDITWPGALEKSNGVITDTM